MVKGFEIWACTDFLNAFMQELDILASTRIALRLEVHKFDLDLAEALLENGLLLAVE